MYRRAVTLALRLAAYLCSLSVGLVLVAHGEWVAGLAAAVVGVGVWMGGGSLAHLHRLARMLSGHPARTGAVLVALALLVVLWWPVLGIYAVAALVVTLDIAQESLRKAMRAALAVRPPRAVALIRLPSPHPAALRGVIPLPASPIPIFSPA